MTSVVVSFTAPHRISTYYSDQDSVLGYSRDLLRGRTIKLFFGPKTDETRILAAIKKCAELNTTIANTAVYDIYGECIKSSLTFSPFCGSGGMPVACRVSFTEEQLSDSPTDLPSPFIRRSGSMCSIPEIEI